MTRPADAWDEEADYVVVGTGAAGATAGFDLARAGRDVVLVEEGGWFRREDFRPDLYSALSRLWRDFGVQVALGRAMFPVAQGCCVGGSTTINTAIMHRLSRDTWEAWAADDGIRRGLPWEDLERAAETIEHGLGVRANVADRLPSLPLAAALDRLGWAYRAMPRAAPGCQETRRCLQGCPSGGKWSLERSFVPAALEAGARLLTGCRVVRVLRDGDAAAGIEAVRGHREPAIGSRRVRVRARRAVLIAAGAVHSPLLLKASGLRSPHLGRHFQCHIGTNVLAEFERPAAEIDGLGMGCEVRHPADIKFSSIQSTPPEIRFSYVPYVGRDLVSLIQRAERIAAWNTSLPCSSEGSVSRSPFGGATIRITPARADYERVRTGIAGLARLFFELGAVAVYPQIHGVPPRLGEPADLAAVTAASLEPRSYQLNCSHIFGTCRMASAGSDGVVDPSFQVHGTPGLYVIDASVFPSPVGTNPQEAIMTLARHAVSRLLA